MRPDEDHWIISGVLDDLASLALSRDRLSLSDIVDALGARGFGPLIVILAGCLILPIGMVPGLPAVVALFLILIGGRMMTGARRIWMPALLGRVRLSGHLLAVSVARAQPAVLWLRPLLSPRLPFLVESAVMRRLIALILMVTGAVILIAGIIPGIPFILSLHILVLGLAMSARDGLVALAGYAMLLPEIVFILHVFT
jgi:hypothetical protein